MTFVDLVGRFFQGVLDVWISAHLVLIHTDPGAAAENGSFKKFGEKKNVHLTRRVRQVTKTVRRNVGAQNDNYGGQYTRA